MGGLLEELGKKLAERWVSLLVLPGALYMALATVATTLGHRHPFGLSRLTSQITEWADAPTARTAGGQVVLLAAVLTGAATVGLVAQAIGSVVETLHLASDWHTWPRPIRRLVQRITEHRHQRWIPLAEAWHRHMDEAVAGRVDPAARHAARVAMTRISPEPPRRPTWSGDRVHAVAVRVQRDYHLDLATLWPHLWLTAPETVRTEISDARQALSRASTLSAWSLLYLLLAVWWWPATAISAVLAIAGWHRTRVAADTYATLLEATVRLCARDLAGQLGLEPTGPLLRESGAALAHHVKPSPPPRPSSSSSPVR
ncbi:MULTISPECIES: hypothetical protein [unclassified Streptomyces]|uniref:hypothetical protein n=1 Tax=unclassified Streptomyces TaxID=2593676 RepID=UPI002E340B9E|nr:MULTISPECIES: hypothetical protein [unclassified Streptomyces]